MCSREDLARLFFAHALIVCTLEQYRLELRGFSRCKLKKVARVRVWTIDFGHVEKNFKYVNEAVVEKLVGVDLPI